MIMDLSSINPHKHTATACTFEEKKEYQEKVYFLNY